MHTNRKGLPLLAAGCVILFATALNEFIITLLQYADFSGLLGGTTPPGSVIFNHVIIDAFRVTGFLLVTIGIFQALSSKTTQKNELDNRTNACITSEKRHHVTRCSTIGKEWDRSPILRKANISDSQRNARTAAPHVLPKKKATWRKTTR
jgi:hypothetical protein